jgi:hypothetical protein
VTCRSLIVLFSDSSASLPRWLLRRSYDSGTAAAATAAAAPALKKRLCESQAQAFFFIE